MIKIFNKSKAKRRTKRLGLWTKPTREEVKAILNNPRYCVVDKELTEKILDRLFALSLVSKSSHIGVAGVIENEDVSLLIKNFLKEY